MTRPRLIQFVALLLCGGLIYGATRFSPRIDAGRQALNPFGAEDVLENTPPEYAFAIQAFGAFRSLIVNIAFIRAETFKQEGRYYDAMQLATWICKLQPRFPSVWAFQSWNMAWNISVTTFTPEERWNWVYNGVKLLRDEGIPLNPRAVNLYKQLAWIYNNKMSETLDDFHMDYKRNWAWRMHLVLGPRLATLREYRPGQDFERVLFDVSEDPLAEKARAIAALHDARRQRRAAEDDVPHYTTKTLEQLMTEMESEEQTGLRLTQAEIARRAVYDYLKTIVDAPGSLKELYQRFPETQDMVAQLRELGVVITDDELSEDEYWYQGKLAERFFARYRKLMDAPAMSETIARADETNSADDVTLQRFDEILGARARRPAGLELVRFLQRKVLSEAYKLDPELMLYIVENFGPVDWRMVDAQSLYWVVAGLQRTGESVASFQTDKVNTARIMFFSLRNLFHMNKLTFEPNPDDIYKSYIDFAPDVNFVEPMHRAFVTYGPMLDPDPGDVTGSGQIFRGGHINFLTEAIRMLYFSDRITEADHYYDYLRTHYGRRTYTGDLETRYTLPLRDFVLTTMYGSITNARETRGVIRSLLYQAYGELADENVTAYNQHVAKALELHDEYMKEKKDFRAARLKLQPFGHTQIDVFQEWLAEPSYSSGLLVRKARLWRVAPPHLKQWVYDDLLSALARECDVWDFDVAKAFPEPPNMIAFREEHPRRDVERPDATADTPAQAPGGG